MKDYSKLQNGSDIRGVALSVPGGPEVNLTQDAVADLAYGFGKLLIESAAGVKDSDSAESAAGVKDSDSAESAAAEIKVAVGRDPRITGPALEETICETLSEMGFTVFSAGLASTPAMFMTTVFPEYDCDGSIMITASHMPYERNGMKFFTREGGLEKAHISKIIAFAEARASGASVETAQESASGIASGTVQKIDLMDKYSAHLRSIIVQGLGAKATAGGAKVAVGDNAAGGARVAAGDNADAAATAGDDEAGGAAATAGDNAAGGARPLEGLRITVDAGNGGGGFFAEKVLAPLGADVSTSQFLEPDGTFPNHIPNPENKDAMAAISGRVIKEKTDLGLIFDTDVDRASAVDENGKEIAHNGIVAMAAALIAEDHPGTTVVTDSVTSIQLNKFLTETLGLKHLRYKRGYRNVIGKAIELNNEGIDSQLAIETSGHGAYKQNYFLDDGAYLATLIVIKTAKLMREGKGISSVLEKLAEAVDARELRLPFNEDILEKNGKLFSDVGDAVIEALRAAVLDGRISGTTLEEPNYEGVRINFVDDDINGWLLLRKSLHDPIMPLNMEAMVEGGCNKISERIQPILDEYPELDARALSSDR